MPAKKNSVRPPIAKNTGKSINGKYMDDHPELQTGYWKNQVMTYDSALAVERNEIDYMLQSLQSDISDGKTTWIFVIKQLSDVFAVMAFDKLKASKEDLDAAGQCEEMGPLFDNCIKHLHLSDDYSNLILRNFIDQTFPEDFMTYVDQLRSVKPKKDSWNDWILKHYPKKIGYNQQQKQNLYYGHYLMTRATQISSTIRNLCNPLWDLSGIPSGKTVTDMIRAIRTHLYKIHRYKLLIEEFRKIDEVKIAPDKGGWSEEQRLDWVHDQLDTQFMGFRSTTYEDGFLAFLICSFPADHYSGRKLSLTLLVPPGPGEQVPDQSGTTAPLQPGTTAPKATRRNERGSSSSVEGTASASLDRSSGNSQGSSGETGNSLNIVMTHNIQRAPHPGKRQLVEDETDEEIAGLLEESSSLKKLIADIKELDPASSDTEIKEHQMRIVEVI
jgi:hypothetical protein